MLIKYTGSKPLPYILNTPIPFLSKSALIGELSFNPTAEVDNEDWATFLLQECGGAFESVGPVGPSKQEVRKIEQNTYVEQRVGKRFCGKAGKWNGFAWLKKHRCGETHGLKKVQVGKVVIGWELVPIAMADLTLANMPIPWNKPQEGPEVRNGESSDGRDQVRVGSESADGERAGD